MNKQNFKDYFQNYYQKDMEIYRELRPRKDGFCSHDTYYFFCCKLYEKFHNFEYFILCNYEFNLIIQVVYTYFNHNWERFKEIFPDFIYLRANYNFINGGCEIASPFSFLWEFSVRAKRFELKSFEFTNKDRLEADLFFNEYLINIFEGYPDLNMNWDKFVQAMLSDLEIRRELYILSESSKI